MHPDNDSYNHKLLSFYKRSGLDGDARSKGGHIVDYFPKTYI